VEVYLIVVFVYWKWSTVMKLETTFALELIVNTVRIDLLL